jgi:kynurenine 3-monooxygenase
MAVRISSVADYPSLDFILTLNMISSFACDRSPATGLKFKTLHMNSNVTIPVGDGSQYKIPFNTQTFFVFRSAFKSAKKAISLGILPSRELPSRAMNVIRLPDHDIWKIRDGNELREWFAKAFPRLDFTAEPRLINQKEFDRFAETEGLTLPPCQYSPEVYVASPTGEAAVLILGDAAHTFPPDLGEGVNSGLEDVFALDEALSQNEKIGAMAMAYATKRKPEVRVCCKSFDFDVFPC